MHKKQGMNEILLRRRREGESKVVKILEINECSECSHFTYGVAGEMCVKEAKWISDCKDIPTWCPLEDKKGDDDGI